MLTKSDLEQIGGLMDEKFVKFEERFVGRIVGYVGEAFEQNMLPRVSEMIDEKLAPIKSMMVTKDYLDEKLGALRGDLIANDRKLENKTDALGASLVERGALKSSDIEGLERFRIFPRDIPE